jgi:hypothetical protein
VRLLLCDVPNSFWLLRALVENIVPKLAIGSSSANFVVAINIRTQGFGHNAESDSTHLNPVLLFQQTGVFRTPTWWQTISRCGFFLSKMGVGGYKVRLTAQEGWVFSLTAG